MNVKTLKKAVDLAKKLKHVFVATADSTGIPHIAAAETLTFEPQNRLAVAEWFCPATLANIRINQNITLVIWDPDSDTGFQLIGRLEKINDLGVLDGYAPQIESKSILPQVERQLIICIDKITQFKHAPHSDLEE